MKARFTANLNEKHAPVKAFTLKRPSRFHYNKDVPLSFSIAI